MYRSWRPFFLTHTTVRCIQNRRRSITWCSLFLLLQKEPQRYHGRSLCFFKKTTAATNVLASLESCKTHTESTHGSVGRSRLSNANSVLLLLLTSSSIHTHTHTHTHPTSAKQTMAETHVCSSADSSEDNR
jgi:hypothetical protein